MKVVALAGGVGGAKMADGLARALPPGELTVIVNTGDDFELHGLYICPDLDTVMYTLAGVANPQTGWGVAGDTFHALGMIGRYGGEVWFRLGDCDLATHILRTAALRQGEPLSRVTAALASALGIASRILPMTDDRVATVVVSDEGELAFQDYFVRRCWRDPVRGLRFVGVESARAAPGVLEALVAAEVVVLCPSNPFLSLDPILCLAGVREALVAHPRVVAVSPIVAGRALKGPAAKIMAELGLEVSVVSVARHYADFLRGFVLDEQDAVAVPAIEALGICTLAAEIVMHAVADRVRLARTVLAFAESLGMRVRGEAVS
jgi:LPPG:FO 2-phospho-L-lactate transferase